MYVQITDKCNMSCAHCCMNAKKTVGDHMSRSVFMESLQLAARYGENITLGGGEPTIHPEFFEYLDKTIELYHAGMFDSAPFLVTNGKLKSKAHKLLDMVENEESLHVELSQDYFHDAIDPSVVSRFKRHENNRHRYSYSSGMHCETGSAGIRSVQRIMPIGRALTKEVYTEAITDGQCCCEDILVDPKGNVWSCGCKHTRLGWVWQQDVLDGYDREFAHQGGFDPEHQSDDEPFNYLVDLAECEDKSRLTSEAYS